MPAPPSPSPSDVPPPITALSVLIVEDNPVDVATYERYLHIEATGVVYALHHTDTVADGLRLFGELEPDCVLLDHNLPDATSADFLRAIADDITTRPLPVVILTGQGDVDVATEAVRLGAADYLPKGSLDPFRLQSAIEAVVSRYRTERERSALRRVLGHQAERELHHVEERWRALADHLPDGVVVVVDGIVGYANQPAQDLLGRALVGTLLLDQLPTEDRDPVRRLWHTGSVGSIEHRLPDGRRVQHLSIPTTVMDRPGVQAVLRVLPEVAADRAA